MAAPAPHRFTTKDYYRMAETGVLSYNARTELLDGALHDMSPIGPFHGGIVARLARLFTELSAGRWLVWTQSPLHLDEYSEPEPDLMLLKPRPDDYTTCHPRPADVYLLIEVADTSLDYDREEKLPLYGRAGVPEVWLVDLQERSIEVYRGAHVSGYESTQCLRAGEKAHPRDFRDVVVNVAELLKQA